MWLFRQPSRLKPRDILMRFRYSSFIAACMLVASATGAWAQMGPGGPPTVGVVKATLTPIYQSSEYIGRVQAVSKITIRARVTGLLEERDFHEGDEVKQGQKLFVIEQPPYQAAVLQAQGQVIQAEATLRNAKLNLNRSQTLLNTPAGQRSTVDNDTASAGQGQGSLLVAEAELQTAQINLGYTTILSPIDRAGRHRDRSRQRRRLHRRCSGDRGERGPRICPVPGLGGGGLDAQGAICRAWRHRGHDGEAAPARRPDVRQDRHDRFQRHQHQFLDRHARSACRRAEPAADRCQVARRRPHPGRWRFRHRHPAVEEPRATGDGAAVPRCSPTSRAITSSSWARGTRRSGATSRSGIRRRCWPSSRPASRPATRWSRTVVQRVKPGAPVKPEPFTPPSYGDAGATDGSG